MTVAELSLYIAGATGFMAIAIGVAYLVKAVIDSKALRARLIHCRHNLERIAVCHGEDAGVILLDSDSASHWSTEFRCQVYDKEHFSDLGHAIVTAWEETFSHVEHADRYGRAIELLIKCAGEGVQLRSGRDAGSECMFCRFCGAHDDLTHAGDCIVREIEAFLEE